MNVIEFRVKGSSSEPYEVVFTKTKHNALKAKCTCPAGSFGRHCKHRFNILDGQSEGIVSENLEQVKEVVSWIEGSELQATLKTIKELEIQAVRIKRELSKSKNQIAKALN
ncbi:conserved hypothetical protein [Vibrio nigripulchritudo SO65]|uniref:SWIM zinc finger family protein n=1 Tax=Vibrio nigripulchritudo TaxID=28173 RepID=UPI0003B21D35|nr:hypothetical protein [Vibrio nigripulchritudo]CCN37193.1 conserved hypothetical protein [Vibrio nigripulchritudo AM115]CCN41443.1 conserved hypothetical protein [Vibrio nigripulchritudo FTn2]CCN63691.1 conserved hypothetical protein [Vibrio nigripulchritudo POn4]CCN76796.1 conserved hypothetical protein [Vibrio nigripulchritudo SO65]